MDKVFEEIWGKHFGATPETTEGKDNNTVIPSFMSNYDKEEGAKEDLLEPEKIRQYAGVLTPEEIEKVETSEAPKTYNDTYYDVLGKLSEQKRREAGVSPFDWKANMKLAAQEMNMAGTFAKAKSIANAMMSDVSSKDVTDVFGNMVANVKKNKRMQEVGNAYAAMNGEIPEEVDGKINTEYLIAPLRKKDAEGNTYYDFNGHKLYGDDVVSNIANEYVAAHNHRIDMRDPEYREAWSQKTFGKSYDEVINDQYDVLKGSLDITKNAYADYAKPYFDELAQKGASAEDYPAMSDEMRAATALRKVELAIENFKKDGFFSGMHAGALDALEMAIGSFDGAISKLDMNRSLDKVFKGEELNAKDKFYVSLFETEQKLNQIKDEYNRGSAWSEIGAGMSTAIGFMASLGIQSAVTGGASIAGNVAKQTIQEAFEQRVKQGFKKGLVYAGDTAWKTAITNMPATNYAQRRMDQFSLVDGMLRKEETNPLADMYRAYASAYGEMFFEAAGGLVDDGFALAGRKLAQIELVDKALNSKIANRVKDFSVVQGIKEILVNGLKINSLPGEYIEERLNAYFEPLITGDYFTTLTEEGYIPAFNKHYADVFSSKNALVTLATCGGVSSIGSITRSFSGVMNAVEINKLRKEVKEALGGIRNEELKNKLYAAMCSDKPDFSEIANLKWGVDEEGNGIGIVDAQRAAKVIFNSANMAVRRGEMQEAERIKVFAPLATSIINKAYLGVDMANPTPTTELVEAYRVDKNGKPIERLGNVIYGDLDSISGILTVVDSKGVLHDVTMGQSVAFKRTDLGDFIAEQYALMFGKSITKERLAEVIENVREAPNMSDETYDKIVEENGFSVHKKGEIVTLTDGRQGIVQGKASGGRYIVEVEGTNGKKQALMVGFENILHDSDVELAAAQAEAQAEGSIAAPEALPTTKEGEVSLDGIKDAETLSIVATSEFGSRQAAAEAIDNEVARLQSEQGKQTKQTGLDSVAENAQRQKDTADRIKVLQDARKRLGVAEKAQPKTAEEVSTEREAKQKELDDMSTFDFSRNYRGRMSNTQIARNSLTHFINNIVEKLKGLDAEISEKDEAINKAEDKLFLEYSKATSEADMERIAEEQKGAIANIEILKAEKVKMLEERKKMEHRKAQYEQTLKDVGGNTDTQYQEGTIGTDKRIFKFAEKASKILGMEVKVTEEEFTSSRQNGVHRVDKDGKSAIYINPNSTAAEQGVGILAHEIVHELKTVLSPKEWAKLETYIMGAAFGRKWRGSKGYQEMLQSIQNAEMRSGHAEGVSEDKLREEAVAYTIQELIFSGEKGAQAFEAILSDPDTKFSEKVKTIWKKVLEKIKALFVESAEPTKQDIALQKAISAFEGAIHRVEEIKKAGYDYSKRAKKDASGKESHSLATYNDWVDDRGVAHKGTRTLFIERMDKGGFDDAQKADMVARMDTAYEYMTKLGEFTDEDGNIRFDAFNEWAKTTPHYKQIGRDYVKAITSLVSNGDYPINLELTTDCIKREAFTALVNELAKRGVNMSAMRPAQIMTIQSLMQQYGIEVACKLCFVEGKRLGIVNWAEAIVEDWNDALVEAGIETDEYFDFGKDGEVAVPTTPLREIEGGYEKKVAMDAIFEVDLIMEGRDPKAFKEQMRKNLKAVEAYKKQRAEEWANKTKKKRNPADWKPTKDDQKYIDELMSQGVTIANVGKNASEYREAYDRMREAWIEKNPKKDTLSFTPTKTQWDALDKIRNREIATVKAKMVRLIMEHPEMRKKMQLKDLLGSKGLMEIRNQDGEAFADLWSIILQRFGSNTPKPIQDATPYDGEIMTLTEDQFKEANKIGGARLFSFSDFDITKIFDYMQIFFDLEVNKQMLQSYTKEVPAVIALGRSNAKMNISTLANAYVPMEVLEAYKKANNEGKKALRHKMSENAGLLLDENGKIVGINFSKEHSVKPEFAQEIFHDDTRNKDCGAIMVGDSVNHAIFSAAQDWIRMVIPFHLSGIPLAAREKADTLWYFDNTLYQSTRKKSGNGWAKLDSKEKDFEFYKDMNEKGWNMRDKAREYIAWCEERGYRPKFDWGINSDHYRAFCEENGFTPNQQIVDMMDADTENGVWRQYYKFLTDFTAYKPVFNEKGEMIDEIPSPQKPVVANFDFSQMEREVLFEGEDSMLAHREGNINRTQEHIGELADKATAFLLGEVTEEELGLRDDVHYENYADAEKYLNAVNARNKVAGGNAEVVTDADVVEESFSISRDKAEFDVVRDFAVENKGVVMPNLAEQSVPIVKYGDSEKQVPTELKGRDLERWAKKNIIDKDSYVVDSNGVRHDCAITATAIEKYLSSKAIDKSVSRDLHLKVLPLLSRVLANSVEVEVHPDYNKVDEVRKPENGYNAETLMHRFYGAVEVDGEVYRTKSTIKEYRDKNTQLKPYTYEVTNIELLTDSAEDAEPTHIRPVSEDNNSISATKLLQNVEKSYDLGKKVLDESAIESFSISRNNEATIDKWLGKREDFTDEVKSAFKEYIADFKPATQLATTKWYANGVIRIPEDMPKVEQAMEIAQRKKVDALQYNSPMELIEQLSKDIASPKDSFSIDRSQYLEESEIDRAYTSRQMDRIEENAKKNNPFNIAHAIDLYEKFAVDEEKRRAQGKMSAIEEKYAQEVINSYRAVANYGRAILAEQFPDYAANTHANNLKSGKTNLAMVRELFQEYNSDEYMAELFDLVSSVAEKFGTTFRLATIKGAHGNHVANTVQYNTATLNSGTISDQDKARIILHEMIHAATGEGVELCENARLREAIKVYPSTKLRTSVRRLKTLLEDIRNNEEFKGEYGITTVHEMLAELSNPRFVEKLKAHTIWTRIVDAIREIAYAITKMVTGKDLAKSDAYTEVRTTLTEIIEETPMEFIEGLNRLRDAGRIKGVKPLEAESVEEIASLAESEGTTSFSLVRDEAKIAELEASPKRIGYRNVILNEDGSFSSPMATHIGNTGKGKVKSATFNLGEWEEAEENPQLVDEQGKVYIYKDNGGSVKVAYDPYIHNRLDKVNAQFKEAWKRPNLVYVETEVPITDLESGYHADKAKLPVGVHSWSNGDLMLSRYDKPIRIVSWEEVADDWVARFKDRGVEFDIVPPALLPILKERGVEILPPHKGLGADATEAYEASRGEESYSVNRDDKSRQKIGATKGNTSSLDQPFPTRRNPILADYGAKLNKNYESAIDDIIKRLEAGGHIGGDTFLRLLDIALANRDKVSKTGSDYVHLGNGATLRISNHYAIVENFYKKNNTKENYGIVIKGDGKKRYIDDKRVDYLEYAYFPDKMDGVGQKALLDGLKQFVKTGDFEGSLPHPDKIHASGEFKGKVVEQSNSLSRERADIESKAKADGTWLKAPNGKDTNLSPEQWVTIRTKAFKEWFGDWENDPENASKVVDENGEPKVVYHQTNGTVYINRETGENWDELDWQERDAWDERDDWEENWEEQDFYTFSRVNARTTNELDGFFFAPEYDEYHEYGERTIPAFLNIRKPASKEDYMVDAAYNNAGQKERIRMQNEGYDGVVYVEDDGRVVEYIAFEPNQIKSATENIGTFDSANDDIRYSLNRDNTTVATPELEAEANEELELSEEAKEMDAYAKLENEFREYRKKFRKARTKLRMNKNAVIAEVQRILKDKSFKEGALNVSAGQYNRIVENVLKTVKNLPEDSEFNIDDVYKLVIDNLVSSRLAVTDAALKKVGNDFKNVIKKKREGRNSRGETIAKGVDNETRKMIDDFTKTIEYLFKHDEKVDWAKVRAIGEKDSADLDSAIAKYSDDYVASGDAKDMAVLQLLMLAKQMWNAGRDLQDIYKAKNEVADKKAQAEHTLQTIEDLLAKYHSGEKGFGQAKRDLKDMGYTIPQAEKAVDSLRHQLTELDKEEKSLVSGEVNAKAKLIDEVKALNVAIMSVDKEGRIALKERNAQRAEEKRTFTNGILRSIRNPLFRNTIDYNAKEGTMKDESGKEYTKRMYRKLRRRGDSIGKDMVDTFDQVTRKMDVMSIPDAWLPYGFRYQFMMHPEKGAIARADWRFKTEKAIREILNDKIKSVVGKGLGWERRLKKLLNTELYDLAVVASKQDGTIKKDGDVTHHMFTVNEALYIRAAVRQDGVMRGYYAAGLSDENTAKLIEAVEKNYPELCSLCDWVQSEDGIMEQLYEMRNAEYLRLNGIDLPHTDYYFPIKRAGDTIPANDSVGDTIPVSNLANGIGSNKARTNNAVAMDLNAGFFDILDEHISESVQWTAYADLFDKMNMLLRSPIFKRMLKVQGVSVENLKNSFMRAMGETLGTKENSTFAKIITSATKDIVASNVVINLNSALKQMASVTVALGRDLNPELWGYFLKNFPLVTYLSTIGEKAWRKYKGDNISSMMEVMIPNIKWAYDNIPTFAERVHSGNMGMDIFKADGIEKWDKLSGFLKKIGMSANKFMDMVASSAVAKSIYELEYKKNKNRGMSEEEAHKNACVTAAVYINQTQQSDQGAFLSSVQSDRKGLSLALVGQTLTAYNNSALGFNRNARYAMISLIDLTTDGANKKRIKYLTDVYKERGLNYKDAKKFAKRDLRVAIATQINSFIHNTLVNNTLWMYMPNAIALLTGLLTFGDDGDDDDEALGRHMDGFVEKAIRSLIFLVPGATGIITKPLVDVFVEDGLNLSKTSIDRAFGAKTSVAVQPIYEAVNEIVKFFKAKSKEERVYWDAELGDKVSSAPMWLTIIDTGMRIGFGFSSSTLLRMVGGFIEAIKDGNIEDWMNATTQSKALTKLYAERLQPNETMKEYVERVASVYQIINAYKKGEDISKLQKKYVDKQDERMFRNTDFDYYKFKEDSKLVKKDVQMIPIDAEGNIKEKIEGFTSDDAWKGYRLRLLNGHINEYDNDLKTRQVWDEEGIKERQKFYRRMGEATQEFIKLWNADSADTDELALDAELNHLIFIGKEEKLKNSQINQRIRKYKKLWGKSKDVFIDNYKEQLNNKH